MIKKSRASAGILKKNFVNWVSDGRKLNDWEDGNLIWEIQNMTPGFPHANRHTQ